MYSFSFFFPPRRLGPTMRKTVYDEKHVDDKSSCCSEICYVMSQRIIYIHTALDIFLIYSKDRFGSTCVRVMS